MSVNKPTFRVNLAATKKSTERKSLFVDIKPDTTLQVRVLPPVNESGNIFTKVVNHFKMKNDEGFGMALACLGEHGNDATGEVCYLCQLSRLLRNGDKQDQKIAKDIGASPRWYLQVYVYDKDSGTYEGPKMLGLSKTTAEAVSDILLAQDESGDDLFVDVEKGQDIRITRRGAGLNTKYTVAPTGNKMPLSQVDEAWQDKLITDTLSAMDLRVEDVDEQKRAAFRSFEDEIDWQFVEENIG